MSIATALARPKVKTPCGTGRWIAEQSADDQAAIADAIRVGRDGGKTRNWLHSALVSEAGFPYSPSALNIHARRDCNCYRGQVGNT